MINTKIYNRVQTRPVGMPIPPALQDQYLKETFGLTDEDLVALENGTFSLAEHMLRSESSQSVVNKPIYPKKK